MGAAASLMNMLTKAITAINIRIHNVKQANPNGHIKPTVLEALRRDLAKADGYRDRLDEAHMHQVLAETDGHGHEDVKRGYEAKYNKVVDEYDATRGLMDELESLVTSPRHNQPAQQFQDRNTWKCECKLLPPVLEMSASLAVADNCARSLRGAFGIRSSPDGRFEAPASINHTVAKEYVLSVVDEDLKARVIGTTGDLVLQDASVLDTMARVRTVIEAETPIYSRRRTFYEMRQEKDSSFSQFAHRKKTEARSAEIDKMSDADRLIHELLRGMRKGPLFQKFCEQANLTLASMTEIARAYEQSTKLAAEENVHPAAVRVAATETPQDDTANKTAAKDPPKQCPPHYTCNRCGCKGHWRADCTMDRAHCGTCGTNTHTDRACFRKKQQAADAKKESTDKPPKTKRKKSKRKKEKKEKVKDKETADKEKNKKKKKKKK